MSKYNDSPTIIPHFIMRIPNKRLGAPGKLILGLIWSLSHKKSYCWASDRTLAFYSGYSQSSVSSHLTTLEKKGFINRTFSNEGRIIVPLLPDSKVIPLELAKKLANSSKHI